MTEVTPEGKLLELIKRAQTTYRLKKELKIFSKINIVLIILIIVILGALITDIATSRYRISKIKINLPEESMPVSKSPVDDLKTDLDKDIKMLAKENVGISGKDIVRDLNLLGIVTGEYNQAVIENKKTGQTYFLYQGDNLGEFTVHEIRDSEVILDYNGEKIKLKI